MDEEKAGVYHIESVVIVDDKAAKSRARKRGKTAIGAGNVHDLARACKHVFRRTFWKETCVCARDDKIRVTGREFILRDFTVRNASVWSEHASRWRVSREITIPVLLFSSFDARQHAHARTCGLTFFFLRNGSKIRLQWFRVGRVGRRPFAANDMRQQQRCVCKKKKEQNEREKIFSSQPPLPPAL